MGEITDYVELYIEDSDILKEFAYDVGNTLEKDIEDEAPYDQGRLKRAIYSDVRVFKKYALITGTWDESKAPHGIYVLAGSKAVEGKLMRMPWGYRTRRKAIPGNDFLGRGLNKTLEAYR